MRRAQNHHTRSVSANKVVTVQDYDKRGRVEINTRADTLCAGATFEKHEVTGKVIDVNGFHDSLNTIKNVGVVYQAYPSVHSQY